MDFMLLVAGILLGAIIGFGATYMSGCFTFLFAEAAMIFAEARWTWHEAGEGRHKRKLELMDKAIELERATHDPLHAPAPDRAGPAVGGAEAPTPCGGADQEGRGADAAGAEHPDHEAADAGAGAVAGTGSQGDA